MDSNTKNIEGDRSDSVAHPELIARVFADEQQSAFTLFEDDGATVDYKNGSVRTTEITQSLSGGAASVTIGAAQGTYADAPASRPRVVELITDGTQASSVSLAGTALTKLASTAEFDAAASGWYNAGGNLVVAKSASSPVGIASTFSFTLGEAPASIQFTCSNAQTTPGQSVYVVGSAPQLGEWSVASAVKLSPTAYPTWTGTVNGLPPDTEIQWKCIKRQETGYPDTADAWQPGANSVVTTSPSGPRTSSGSF